MASGFMEAAFSGPDIPAHKRCDCPNPVHHDVKYRLSSGRLAGELCAMHGHDPDMMGASMLNHPVFQSRRAESSRFRSGRFGVSLRGSGACHRPCHKSFANSHLRTLELSANVLAVRRDFPIQKPLGPL